MLSWISPSFGFVFEESASKRYLRRRRTVKEKNRIKNDAPEKPDPEAYVDRAGMPERRVAPRKRRGAFMG